MIWSADTQIKVPHSDGPLTSHGPALAASASRLYMAYIGKEGSNVFWAWTDNQTGNFTDWQGDSQIKLDGSNALHSADRPALAFFNNFPVLFTITSDHKNLQCSWFDGNQWHGYSLNILLGNEKGLRVVSAQVFNGQLHIVVVTDHGPWFHCVCTGDVTQQSSWSVPGGPGTGLDFASMVVHAGSLVLVATALNGSGQPNYYAMNPNVPFSSFTQPSAVGAIEIASGSPKIAPAPSAVSLNNVFTLVFLEASSQNLYTASASGPLVGNLLLSPSAIIRTSTATAKTRMPPAAIVFNGQLCIAHAGDQSDNLYLTYGH